MFEWFIKAEYFAVSENYHNSVVHLIQATQPSKSIPHERSTHHRVRSSPSIHLLFTNEKRPPVCEATTPIFHQPAMTSPCGPTIMPTHAWSLRAISKCSQMNHLLHQRHNHSWTTPQTNDNVQAYSLHRNILDWFVYFMEIHLRLLLVSWRQSGLIVLETPTNSLLIKCQSRVPRSN